MLAAVTVNNTEQTVYTVPQNKTAYVYIDIFASEITSISVKVNNLSYFSESEARFISLKLCLNAGDTLKVQTPGVVNVFVHGMEV